MEKIIFCFLTATLFALALGADERCSNVYRPDDECDTNEPRLGDIFHFNSNTQKCYAGDYCESTDKSKYFSSLQECKTKCDVKETGEEVGSGGGLDDDLDME
uniref:Putative secreted protein n=1 Tax=Amblyomma triste TaxID=251400 RepID=A0A023G406_AMBTT